MTDETKDESAELPIDVAAVVVGDEYGIEAEAAIAVESPLRDGPGRQRERPGSRSERQGPASYLLPAG